MKKVLFKVSDEGYVENKVLEVDDSTFRKLRAVDEFGVEDDIYEDMEELVYAEEWLPLQAVDHEVMVYLY